MNHLTVGEQKAVGLILEPKKDTVIYAIKLLGAVNKSRKENEKLLVLGKFRLYLIRKEKGKLLSDSHLLDITKVTSDSPSHLVITTKNFSFTSSTASPIENLDQFLMRLFDLVEKTFPCLIDKFPLVISTDRVESIKKKVDFDESLCGNFVESYRSTCDYIGISPLEDICFDIDNLFVWNDVTEFNSLEISTRANKLNSVDWIALFLALHYNPWFNSLIIDNLKYEKDTFGGICDLFTVNSSIQKLVIRNAQAPSSFWIALSDGIKINPNCSLQYLDFSGNHIEDKGAKSLAKTLKEMKKEIISFNVSNNSIGIKGLKALLTTFCEESKLFHFLENLGLDGCKMDGETSKLLGDLIAKATKLTDLSLENNLIEFKYLKRCENLSFLNLSGFKFSLKDSRYLDAFRFFKLCPRLLKLNISCSDIPYDILPDLISSLPSLKFLDLSLCSLGDRGVLSLGTALSGNKTIKSINLSGNFERRTKLRAQMLEKLEALISGDSAIEELYLTGSIKSQLKVDLIPFLFSLMTNSQLRVLDISGNAIGHSLAVALAKILATNSSLERLYFDDNGTTLAGLEMIKIGLMKNQTIKLMPLPMMDIVTDVKNEKFKPLLISLMREMEKKLFDNCKNNLGFEKDLGSKMTRKRSMTRIASQCSPSFRDAHFAPAPKTHLVKPELSIKHASTLFTDPKALEEAMKNELDEEEFKEIRKESSTEETQPQPQNSNED